MTGTLIFFAGKMGAGKSTRSQQIAADRNAVLISEDEWLTRLYPGEVASIRDYVRLAKRMKPLLEDHIANILRIGVDVVMDFPGNTREQRAWFRKLIDASQAPHELIYLKVSDERCLKQLAKRRVKHPARAEFDTEAFFRKVTQYFEAPDAAEGFVIRVEERD